MSDEPTQPRLSTPSAVGDGRYVLGDLLGAGGMGIVLRGRDELLHRDVAVKLLADNLAADPEARERFTREARAAARITDRHVVAVYDVGEEAGRPYLVMEFVDGRSLSDILHTDGPVDPDDLVDIATQSLLGLARAHAAGLLHRDIKPGNLLLDRAGTVKVTDFGVAEAADVPGLTRTGFVIGTRSYLAPERRRGEPATVRTDLWALGGTLLELATGRPPSDEHGAAQMPADTPQSLRLLMERLLAGDPQDRPASAEVALEILAGGGVTGRTVPLLPTTPPPYEPPDTLAAAPAAAAIPAGTTEVMEVEEAVGAPAPTRRTPWGKVAVAAALLLAIAVAFRVAGDDQPEAVPGVPAVERDADDPAQTARNLAEWLRERADD